MKKISALAAVAAMGLSLSGAQAADSVTVQLKWVAQAQFAGYFVAKEKGFYKEAGLDAAGHVERDLMRSYGATPAQTLTKLNLPAAMPFVFNALKINSTLALIGAIVAEFFGTPTLGIGFRISTEVGRMALDMVWAEIALSAITGMAFYGLVALAERRTTFWHPSHRA